MEENKKCPKCNGQMEKGLIADRGHYNINMMNQIWGTRIKGMLLSNVENKKNVIVYCCKNCGYLESYAK